MTEDISEDYLFETDSLGKWELIGIGSWDKLFFQNLPFILD